MIRVKVELVPFGIEENAKEIGNLVIFNDASGSSKWGNYKFSLTDDRGRDTIGIIKRHDRNLDFWFLLAKVIRKALKQESLNERKEKNE